MKRLAIFPKLFSLIFMIVLPALLVGAQEAPPEDMPPQGESQERQRPNLLRELGLSPDQIRQIRQLNIERKPLMEAAQLRLREANRELDMAIYADGLQDEEIQQRLKEFQTAQAEIAKIRFSSELAVRKLLTPEQLVKFRSLRQRFAEARKNFQERRRVDNLPKLRRMNRPIRPAANQ